MPILVNKNSFGFTLIELLVAMSILAILSVVAFVNYKDFSQDQILIKAQDEIQTFLRLTQSNATSSVLCESGGGSNWVVDFKADKVTINIICGPNNIVKKRMILQDAKVDSIKGSSCSSITDTTFDNSLLRVSFSPLYGSLSFTGVDNCIRDSSTVTINLLNTRNNSGTRSFNISKGGGTNVF